MSTEQRDAFEDFARRDLDGRGVDPDTAARVVEDTYGEEEPAKHFFKATFKKDGETVARVVRAANPDEAMSVVWNNGGSASVMVERLDDFPYPVHIPKNLRLGW